MNSRQLTRFVQRLSSASASRSFISNAAVSKKCFSTARPLFAKGDNSTIDYFKFPGTQYSPEENDAQIKIPSMPDSWTTLNSRNPAPTEEDGIDKIDAEFKPNIISHVSGQATASIMSDSEPLTKGQKDAKGTLPNKSEKNNKKDDDTSSSAAAEFFKSFSSSESYELKDWESPQQKQTLLFIVAGVVAWWVLGDAVSSYSDKKKEQKEKK